MRKSLKVALWTAGVMAVAGVGVLPAEWRLVRRTPAWYAPDTRTAEQRASAADRFEDTLVRLYNWSAGRHARQVAARQARPSLAVPLPSAGEPTHSLSFTDGQLNAFVDRWAQFQNRRAVIEQYVHDPQIVVQDGQIIVAGQVRELGLVVSLFVQPQVDAGPAAGGDGRLRLTLDKVVAGVVPVPQSFYAGQRAGLERVLSKNLPADQQAAQLDVDGLANGPAATAAMDEMLLALLRGRSAEPVVFVPVDPSASAPLLPVRITAVTAADHTLTLVAQAMTPAERQDLLRRIKVPDAGD